MGQDTFKKVVSSSFTSSNEVIDSFLVQTGFIEVLEFREDLVNIRNQLHFQTCALLNGLLTEPAKFL